MRKMDKKGVEITLNFIVIAALVLIALVVAIIFFTGAGEMLFKKKGEITREQLQREITLAEQLCTSHCTFGSPTAFENPAFSDDLANAGYKTCSDLPKFKGGYDEFCGDCTGSPECLTKDTRTACVTPCVWKIRGKA